MRAPIRSSFIVLALGSWRSTLIIAASIPLSVLAALAALATAGETLKVMTLGALFDHVEQTVRGVVPPHAIASMVDNMGLPNSGKPHVQQQRHDAAKDRLAAEYRADCTHAPTADAGARH
ncbi:hypothetical protein NL30_12450 [Burkholderia contaminans]|nr:hypothetical protein [Burkholderia contaminans]AKM40641.1 hypothetical protein NL30_12450 [Burkholderia contaminans]